MGEYFLWIWKECFPTFKVGSDPGIIPRSPSHKLIQEVRGWHRLGCRAGSVSLFGSSKAKKREAQGWRSTALFSHVRQGVLWAWAPFKAEGRATVFIQPHWKPAWGLADSHCLTETEKSPTLHSVCYHESSQRLLGLLGRGGWEIGSGSPWGEHWRVLLTDSVVLWVPAFLQVCGLLKDLRENVAISFKVLFRIRYCKNK